MNCDVTPFTFFILKVLLMDIFLFYYYFRIQIIIDWLLIICATVIHENLVYFLKTSVKTNILYFTILKT